MLKQGEALTGPSQTGTSVMLARKETDLVFGSILAAIMVETLYHTYSFITVLRVRCGVNVRIQTGKKGNWHRNLTVPHIRLE